MKRNRNFHGLYSLGMNIKEYLKIDWNMWLIRCTLSIKIRNFNLKIVKIERKKKLSSIDSIWRIHLESNDERIKYGNEIYTDVIEWHLYE
jgi:hypothetical protein